MKPKVATARAISAYLADRSLRLISIIFLIIVACLGLVIGLLALNYSAWWWLLLTPLIIISLIFWLFRLVIKRLIKITYRHPFSRDQRVQLEGFTSKIQRILEARATPLPIYALIALKDLVIHKDLVSIRELIDDSKTLKQDFSELEKYFGQN